jgi:hypothetical protein
VNPCPETLEDCREEPLNSLRCPGSGVAVGRILDSLLRRIGNGRAHARPCIGGRVASLVLLLFAILVLVPWRWEAAGGLLLVVMSLLIGATYAIATASIVRNDGSRLPLVVRAVTTLLFGGPPLVAGILFLLHYLMANARAGAR